MILLNAIGGLGFLFILVVLVILKREIKTPMGTSIVESFVELMSQAIDGFNRRVIMIFIQLIFVSNTLYVGALWLQSQILSIPLVLAFDLSIMIFGCAVFLMLKVFPNALSTILNKDQINSRSLIKHVIVSGCIQTGLFFGVFISSIYIFLIMFDAAGLLALAGGILIASFYYRSAGGSYKAAAENGQTLVFEQKKRVLTHPSDILIKTGAIIASVGGYYLDVFGSWIIAIAAFFVVITKQLGGISLSQLVLFPEVQWVLGVIVCTAVAMILVVPFAMIRKNVSNIFLEMGYFITIITMILLLILTHQLTIFDKHSMVLAVILSVFAMLGIAFFTNYLTSANHSPIKYICRQAQYGGANVLISSFFNGLIGNAVFTLLILIILIYMYSVLGVIGLIMAIIYALSIAVIACSIKVFSVISNQVLQIIEYENNQLMQPSAIILKKVSYTLVAIGNSFSSAAGLLSSAVILIAAISLVDIKLTLLSMDVLLGAGLGAVIISVFYAVSIGGTYRALTESEKEVKRQCADIPQLNEEHKAHPNMQYLSDRHSLNGLSAITLPGIWIIISLALIYFMISQQGVYGALVGMFIAIFIHSFFWSIFGDYFNH